MPIHYTPAQRSGLDPKLEEEWDRQADEIFRPTREALGPELAAAAEKDRVTDLLYDAAAKQDRAEFHRLWQEHVAPLAEKREREQPSQSPPIAAPGNNPRYAAPPQR